MAEYDSNMIKPVESLQNFSRLDSTGRREERKRRQQLQEQNDEENESSEDKLKENIDENSKSSGGRKIRLRTVRIPIASGSIFLSD